jgi:RNA polymerase sigma factor for flagellar operon FliA
MASPERNCLQKSDPAQIDKVISEFAPVIRYMAQRLAFRLPPSLDVNDLVHAGVIGLMDAIGKYDPSREVQFKTYAEFRIRGAMLDEIRSLDWIPRSVREKIGQFQKAFEALGKRLGRAPSEEEVAKELHMGVEQFDAFFPQARAAALLSLEDLGLKDGDDRLLIESLVDSRAENPLLSLLSQETREKLVQAIDGLPTKERQVVGLYYQEELTMKEIGRVLKVTESRVCQLHAQAILRLKGKLGEKQDAADR